MGLPRGAQIYITEVGLTCALGRGLNVVMDALQANECGLSLHDVHGYPTAVGHFYQLVTVARIWLWMPLHRLPVYVDMTRTGLVCFGEWGWQGHIGSSRPMSSIFLTLRHLGFHLGPYPPSCRTQLLLLWL